MKPEHLWRNWRKLKITQGYNLGWVPPQYRLEDTHLRQTPALVDKYVDLPVETRKVFEEMSAACKQDAPPLTHLLRAALAFGAKGDTTRYRLRLVSAIEAATKERPGIVLALKEALVLSLHDREEESLAEVRKAREDRGS